MPYTTSIFHICTIISLIAMIVLLVVSVMHYQREKQHENDVKSAVREYKQPGWEDYISISEVQERKRRRIIEL